MEVKVDAWGHLPGLMGACPRVVGEIGAILQKEAEMEMKGDRESPEVISGHSTPELFLDPWGQTSFF